MKLTIEVDERSAEILQSLGAGIGYKTAEETLQYLAMSILDGVRRPGSWERELLSPLFGDFSAAIAAACVHR